MHKATKIFCKSFRTLKIYLNIFFVCLEFRKELDIYCSRGEFVFSSHRSEFFCTRFTPLGWRININFTSFYTHRACVVSPTPTPCFTNSHTPNPVSLTLSPPPQGTSRGPLMDGALLPRENCWQVSAQVQLMVLVFCWKKLIDVLNSWYLF